MKNILSIALFSLMSFGLFAQQSTSTDFKVGDNYIIEKTDNQDFDHLKFPKKNFIIKRGGIADLKGLSNTVITIVEISESGDWVTLKKADGTKFFNRYPVVRAHLPKALQAGELKAVKP